MARYLTVQSSILPLYNLESFAEHPLVLGSADGSAPGCGFYGKVVSSLAIDQGVVPAGSVLGFQPATDAGKIHFHGGRLRYGEPDAPRGRAEPAIAHDRRRVLELNAPRSCIRRHIGPLAGPLDGAAGAVELHGIRKDSI